MTTWRIRFVEKIHEDGIMAIEVVVDADNQFSAVARATLIAEKTGSSLTWVDEVSEVLDPMST
jgi:hypothetical protein